MRKFTALMKRWDSEHARAAYQVGMLCAVIINNGMRAPREAAKPSDFVPAKYRQPDPEPDPEEIDRRVEALMSNLPGGYIVKDAAGNIIEERVN